MSMILDIKRNIKNSKIASAAFAPAILARRAILRRNAQRFEAHLASVFQDVESGSLVLRLKDYDAAIEFDYRSHLLLRLLKDREYESEIMTLVKKFVDPQRDVIDVGANVGVFTVLCAKLIEPGNCVLAFEPTPNALHYLRRNITRNAVDDVVKIFEGAATSVQNTFNMNVIPGMEEYSSLGTIAMDQVKDKKSLSIMVQGQTIDNLVAEHGLNPGFIKIDTEGAELGVLQGAGNTLKVHRPVILSELSDTLLAAHNTTSKMVLDLLNRHGYIVTDAERPGSAINSPFVGEMLAVPTRN